MHDLWRSLVTSSGRELSAGQVDQLEGYLERLIKANEVMNLTRIFSPDDARLMHVADALTVLKFVPYATKTLIDVGSGGGVPGIPLAIALPETQVTLVEATQKKANFLLETARHLGLANLTVVPQRAEDAGAVNSKLRESADVVTARAVAHLAFLVEWCMPLARLHGQLLLMKGPKLQEELPEAKWAIKAMFGSSPVVHPVTELPGVANHVICAITKNGRTDPKYPRHATVAKGKHL